MRASLAPTEANPVGARGRRSDLPAIASSQAPPFWGRKKARSVSGRKTKEAICAGFVGGKS
ncbi:hypothetical protein C4K27_4563 [Pseudomonas chlororaphis subsp. chlororaphis]|nr:hypothetical protein C4K27_4563 [Pseudomonas chlororaphis subsp. chlororaphis]